MHEVFDDYSLGYDTATHRIELEDYDGNLSLFNYTSTGDSLLLHGKMNGSLLDIKLHKLNLDSLPLLQPGTHWTVD